MFMFKLDAATASVQRKVHHSQKRRYHANHRSVEIEAATGTNFADWTGEGSGAKKRKLKGFQRNQEPARDDVASSSRLPSGPGNKDDDLIGRADQVLQHYAMVMNEDGIVMSESSVRAFVALHSVVGCRISQKDFVVLVMHLVKAFTTFARSQPLFRSFHDRDQIHLLFRNAPLYVQYVLARYFASENGRDQLDWILGMQLPVERILRTSNRLVKISPQDLGEILSFSKQPHVMTVYTECAIDVTRNFGCSHLYNGLVANMVLYYSCQNEDENGEKKNVLQESNRIRYIFDDCKNLLDQATTNNGDNSEENFAQFFRSLETMKNIFNNCRFRFDNNAISHLSLGFTVNDECFLNDKYVSFRTKHCSVSMTDLVYKTYCRCAVEKMPVPAGFMPFSIKLFLQRFRETFYNFTECSGIRRNEQNRLWNRNCVLAVAFNILQLETASSGDLQHDYLMGMLYDNSSTKSLGRRSSFNFLGMNLVNGGRLSDPDLKFYSMLVNKAGHLVKDGVSFMLVTMLAMLNDPETKLASPEKIALEKQTFCLFQHHLRTVCEANINESHFNMLLHYMKGISQFVPRLAAET